MYFTMKNLLIIIIATGLLFGCSKENTNTKDYNFKISTQGEDVIKIDWEGDSDNIVQFTIDYSNDFSNPIKQVSTNLSEETFTIDDLLPLTNYFVKIEILDNNSSIWSEIQEFKTSFTIISDSYQTEDDFNIACKINYISTKLNSLSRTVIFMHEFSKNKSSWDATNLIDSLVLDGYLCVTFDFRGHGSSTSIPDATVLIDEPWNLRKDFDATLKYIETLELPFSDEVIVVGASMGACIATSVSTYPNVIGGIASSTSKTISEKSIDTNFAPKGIFYLASELDKNAGLNIDYMLDAYALSDITGSPTKVFVLKSSGSHGILLIQSSNELKSEILEWVRSL